MNGCGEFAYKQGASARDLENTKKSCLAKSTNQAIVDKCVEDNGWFVQSLGAADPMEIFKISSWWKMGCVDGLNIDLGECVAVLGEAHRPISQTHQVTRGLLLCMREKGWRGLRER